MRNKLTWLKPLVTSDLKEQRYASMWNALIRTPSDTFNELLEQMYFKVFDTYQITSKATQLVTINRSYGKRWVAFLKSKDLPSVNIESMLRGAAASKTVPLIVSMHSSGGVMLLPTVVINTIHGRLVKNMDILDAAGLRHHVPGFMMPYDVPAGYEELPDPEHVQTGLVEGPALNEAGINIGLAPFETMPEPMEPAQLD